MKKGLLSGFIGVICGGLLSLVVSSSAVAQSQTLTILSANTMLVDGSLTASVTTTATVSSGGAITFSISSGSGSATVNPTTGLITAIGFGTVTLTATSTGDTNYNSATTSQLITIGKSTPTLTITSANTLNVDGTLTATTISSVTGGRGGAFTFSVVAGSGSATVNANTGFITAIGSGTITLTVTSAGDTDYFTASTSQEITIGMTTPTLIVTSANTIVVDAVLTATITTTAGHDIGTLSYNITNGTGSAIVDPLGVISAISAGDITLTVTSAGNSDYYSTIVDQLITIGMTTPTLTITSANTISLGGSLSAITNTTATYDRGGAVTFSITAGSGSATVDANTGLINTISAGTVTLTAMSAGDADYNSATTSQLITIAKGTPTLTILSANTMLVDGSLTASVSTTATVSSGGAITFSISSGSGSATVNPTTGLITAIGFGTVTLTATSTGDTNYNSDTTSQLITIGKSTPTLTITSANSISFNSSLTATVSTTSTGGRGGAFTFSIVAGSGSATVNPTTGLITAIEFGTVTLTATSAGDTNYNSAITSQLITIGQTTPTLTITSANSISVGDSLTATVTTTAAGSQGGAITFSITNGSGSASVNPTTGLITVISIGTVTLTVSSAGDTYYYTANASQLITIVANIPTTISSFSPASGPISTTVTINGTNFDSTPFNNVVFFGAARATVLTASPSALTVRVPSGANYQYISVTRLSTNSTAYSAKPFIVTFSSSGTIDFANDGTVTVSGALLTYHMAIGDLNADGKPDLVVIDNNEGTNANTTSAQPGNSNVYVFLNTSTSSGVISYSLNNTLTLPFNNGPAYTANHATTFVGSFALAPAASDGANNIAGVSMEDMDGDGKRDIAITFKNEKISGNTVNTSGDCSNMSIYITTYNTYKLAAFRNTTASGSSSLTFGSSSLATFEGAVDNSTAQQGSANLNNNGFCDPFSPASTGGNGKVIRDWYTHTSPTTPVYLPYGRNITVADFDGDGKPDIAIAKELANTVSIYRNTSTSGTVSFATSQIFTVGSTSSYDLAAGDLDNDGKSDLIITNNGSANVTILKNQSTPGTLNFTTAVTLPVGTNPQALALGDFDGDDKLDLVVANNGSNSVSFFRNTNATTGTISFPGTASLTMATGTNPFGLTLGDVDGDGKVDLAVENTGSNTVQVFKNTTAGVSLSFTVGASYATGASPQGVVMGDMNGDGKPDLAVTNASTGISFLRNIIPTPVVVTSFSPASGPISTSVTITGRNFNSTASQNVVFFGATQATVTGATSTSLTVVVPYGANYQYFSVTNLYVNSTGYSAKPFVVTFPSNGTAVFVAGSTLSSNSAYRLAIGDLNGDGKPDLVVGDATGGGNNNANVYLNTSIQSGAISYVFSQTLAAGINSIGKVAFGDMDGDGKLDVVVASANGGFVGSVSIFRNTTALGSSSITFAAAYTQNSGGNPRDVTIADFDGDGRLDIASCGDNSPFGISVFRNTSVLGTVSFASFQTIGAGSLGTSSYSLASGDFDFDGKPDLVVLGTSIGFVRIFHNTSSSVGTIAFSLAVTLNGISRPRGVVVGDFDDDNKLDIAIVDNVGNSVSFFRNTNSATGTISFPTTASLTFSVGSSPNGIALGDMDGDGKIDVSVANTSSNSAFVLKNTSTGVGNLGFTNVSSNSTGSSPFWVAIGDMNNDGQPDIAVSNNGSNMVSFFQNTSVAQTSQTLTFTSASTTTVGGALTATITSTATLSSGGATTYSVTAGSGSATVNPTTGLMTAISIGTVTLTATSAGDTNYYAATTSQLITISKGTPTLVMTSASTMTTGTSITATVTTNATGGRGGAITFAVIGGSGSATVDPMTGLISAVSVGTVTLISTSAGDTNYNGATVSQLITITGGSQTLTVTSASIMTVDGALTASVTTTATFGRGGTLSYGIVNGTGIATVNPTTGLITAIGAGAVTLTVSSSGDADYNSATTQQLITIGKATPVLTVTSSSLILLNTSLTATVSTTATSGRGGTFSYNIGGGSGSATVDSNGLISATAVGSVTLVVTSSGDTNYNPATTSQGITIATFSVSNSATLAEGQTGAFVISLAPSGATLSSATTFTISSASGSTANAAHYTLPSTVILPASQNSVSVTVQALADQILYNDELLIVNFTNSSFGTFTGTLTITDITALNPNNLVITIGNATIYQNQTVPVTVSLPAGVTSAVPIDVALGIGSSSVLHLSSYTLPIMVTIPANSNTASFDVSGASSAADPSTLIITGAATSSLSNTTYTVLDGIVVVIGQQMNIVQGFSPNGDGIGDTFTINNITTYPDNIVTIVNTSGGIVYQGIGYNNDSVAFKGYAPDGNPLPPGNYFLHITYFDEKGNPQNHVNFLVLKNGQ